MEKTQAQIDKDTRLEEYNIKYADQLRLLGYIRALEADNESIRDTQVVTNRAKRRAKKLIKINDKDIKAYNRLLSNMPEVPPFK